MRYQPIVGVVQINYSLFLPSQDGGSENAFLGCKNGRAGWTEPRSPTTAALISISEATGRLVTDVRADGKGISGEKEREATSGQREG
jgi:hypothetical protein